MHKQGCCLGFDFGLRKIGAAVGQFITLTATPLDFIIAKQGMPDWRHFKKLLDEWRPNCLVVGLPLAINGEPLSVTPFVESFAQSLKRFDLPVYYADERMTTKEARQDLFERGGYKALTYGKVDSIAAAIILEQWMSEVQ